MYLDEAVMEQESDHCSGDGRVFGCGFFYHLGDYALRRRTCLVIEPYKDVLRLHYMMMVE